MEFLRVLVSRFRAVFGPGTLDRDLDDELRYHVEMEIEENIRKGMPPQEARRVALRDFGGVAQISEDYRDRRGVPLIETLLQDVRYAMRGFRKAPAFTAVAVASLALGIGANTAIFTLADQLLLRLLPVRNPEQLVRFEAPGPGLGMQRDYPNSISYPLYTLIRDHGSAFDGVIAQFGWEVNMLTNGDAERVNCDLVSGNYFQVLGVTPAVGRVLGPEDDNKPGGHPVVVLTHDFWQRRFGGDPSIVGRSVTFNQTPMTIVGVAQRGFNGVRIGAYTQVIAPIMMKKQMVPWWPTITDPRQAWLHVFARLKPGVSREQAAGAVNGLYAGFLAEQSQNAKGIPENIRREFLARRLEVVPGMRGHSNVRGMFDRPLKVLGVLVGLVLLIACANIAGLLSARSAARKTEFAIRLAVGASRARIIRQLIVESLLLAGLGALVAIPIAWWTAGTLLSILPFNDVARALHADPDARTILFTIGVALLSALLFGLLPALQTVRPSLATTLRSQTSATSAAGNVRLRQVLVAAQVALSLLLTIAAGLFVRSVYNLKSSDFGFETEHLVLATIDPTLSGYDIPRTQALIDQIDAKLKSIPGVRSTGMAGWGAFNNTQNFSRLKIEGRVGEEGKVEVNQLAIGPGTLAAMGVRLVAGREFDLHDNDPKRPVAIVTESFAKKYFTGTAVGRHIGNSDIPGAPGVEIVGVAKDIAPADPRTSRRDFVFEPLRQWGPSVTTFHVRTSLEPKVLFEAIRREIRSADPSVPISEMQTMDFHVDEALFMERMTAILSTCFGALALTLAAVGLYGVIAWSVARRTRELGIRMAMGAGKRDVLALVLKDIALMLGAGMAAGFAAALALGRILRAQLFGVEPTDPLIAIAAILLLALVGIAAGLIPARRATQINVVTALRYE
jgi:predicted permease